jgi:ribosomal protein L37E
MYRIPFLVFLFSFNAIYAQTTIELFQGDSVYEVKGAYVGIYKDPSRKLNSQQTLKHSFNLSEIDYNKNPDWKSSNFWFKFRVRNNSSSERWLIEIPDFHIQHISFYSLYEDSLQESGYSEAFGKRHYQHKNFIYDLNVPYGEERTFLAKMSSSKGFGSALKIYPNASFISYATKEYLLLGFFYGFLMLNAFYNLFMFISIRDKAHLFYFFYILSIGLRTLLEDGLGFQFFWSSRPELNSVFNVLAPVLLLITFSLYASIFLNLKNRFPLYYRSLLICVFTCLVFDLANAFFLNSFYLDFIYVLPFVVIYIISILTYKKGYKPARFFIIGYSLFILSLFISYLRSVGQLEFENDLLLIFHVYSFNIGFAVEAFVFSLSLADKIKFFKKEKDQMQQEKEKIQEQIINQLTINEELKDKVNRELENKVAERTKDLSAKTLLIEEANIKLQEQAEKINKMNQLLDIENYKLKTDVRDTNKDRGLLKALSFEQFVEAFPDESYCYRFIEELKWGNGYECRKCGNKKYMKVKNPFNRKCTRCGYNESVKKYTIFHDIKFPIEKAFQIIYLTLITEKEVSTYDLASKLGIRQKTSWSFRKRILDKMLKEKISNKDILERGWSILICE